MSWTTSDRTQRLPPGWKRRIVPRILARDHHTCYLCGRPGADAVDHIRAGDDHSDSNLAAVHQNVPPYCHRYKSSFEGQQAYRARQAQLRHPGERHPGMS